MDKQNHEQRIAEIEKLLAEILDISRQEREFVEKGQWEKTEMDFFNKLLEKRQSLTDRVDAIRFEDEEYHILKQQGDQQQLTVLEMHRKRCRNCIKEIQTNDQASRDGMEKAAEQSSAKIVNARGAKKANKAYTQYNQEAAWFFDKRK